MSIVLESILSVSGKAEIYNHKGSGNTLALLENANRKHREAAIERLTTIVGPDIVNACKISTEKWAFTRGTHCSEFISLDLQKLTRFLSNGIHIVANSRADVSDSIIEMRTPQNIIPAISYSYKLDSKSSVYTIDAHSVWSLIKLGATLTIRHADHFFSELAFISDELTTITGSTTFAKLFITDGLKSTSGRHFDSSDVIILMLSGRKHFRIESPEEINLKGFDKTVIGGDALFLPTPWPHLVTPVGEPCIHVTIGIRQNELWKKNDGLPTHLGYSTSYDDSILPGLLRAKLPPDFIHKIHAETNIRSACPGGLICIDDNGGNVKILGAGRIVAMSYFELSVLTLIHEHGVISVREISKLIGVSLSATLAIIDELKEVKLVGVDAHYTRYSKSYFQDRIAVD